MDLVELILGGVSYDNIPVQVKIFCCYIKIAKIFLKVLLGIMKYGVGKKDVKLCKAVIRMGLDINEEVKV